MVGIKEFPYILSSYMHKREKMAADVLFAEMNSKLDNHVPFAAGKLGGFELWALRAVEFGYKSEYAEVYDKLCNNAGFFSYNTNLADSLKLYVDRMMNTLPELDYLIRWQYPKEEFFVRRKCSPELVDIDWLGTVYQGKPIGRILRGKKVLVITPFTRSVEYQYSRRELVYTDEYLPDFDLLTYKSVQTVAGNRDDRFNDWFEALDFMNSEISQFDFDIALVGCGAYSLPLCAEIKKIGKSAIHMGGDVQILFGIMGKRWENNEFVKSVRNDYWIYPNKDEIPKDSERVEDGCYW